MKTIKMTLLALVAAFVISCKSSDDENVITPVDITKTIIGQTWIYSDITGKVNYGAKVTGNVTVYKDGKNQYAFSDDLSKAAFVFKEGGKVEVFDPFFNRSETQNWEVSTDNKKILIWEDGDKDWATEWEIVSVTDSKIVVKESDWDQIVKDSKLTSDTTVMMDVTITLVPKK